MKTNRKVVRSVICVLLALIFVVSLMTALIPVNASAASQSEINQLTQQRKELQAKQKEQQKTISNLRSKKASIVEQKAALDQEMNLAQQEIEVVKEQITAYDQQIEDKGVELEAAKQEEEAQTVRFRGCVISRSTARCPILPSCSRRPVSPIFLPVWTWSARSLHTINRCRPT